MNQLVVRGEEAQRRLAVADRVWLGICALFAVAAVLLFGYYGVRYADETQHELRLIPDLRYDQRLDFNYFYSAALMVRHGDADIIYPDCGPTGYPNCGEPIFWPGDANYYERGDIDEYTKAKGVVRGSYFGPPSDAFLEAPLAWLSFRNAYWLFTGLSVAALGGFGLLAWRAGRGVPELPLLLLGVAAFRPVHETLIMAHLALFFVLALTAGFLLLRGGRPALAGLVLSLMALKPQWAVLPAVFLLVRGEFRALAVMATLGALIFFGPFLITGLDTFRNYVTFIADVAAFNLKEAPHMFSWNGLLFKMTGEAVDKQLYYGLIAVSLVPLLVAWWSRDFNLGAAATVVAMLLVNNHSVWYDWALLSVAALFLVLRSPEMRRGHRLEMWVVLLALYVTAGQSIGTLLHPGRHNIDWYRTAFYWVTPVACFALFWIGALAVREGRVGVGAGRS